MLERKACGTAAGSVFFRGISGSRYPVCSLCRFLRRERSQELLCPRGRAYVGGGLGGRAAGSLRGSDFGGEPDRTAGAQRRGGDHGTDRGCVCPCRAGDGEAGRRVSLPGGLLPTAQWPGVFLDPVCAEADRHLLPFYHRGKLQCGYGPLQYSFYSLP